MADDDISDDIKAQARAAVQPGQPVGTPSLQPPIDPDLPNLDIKTVADSSPSYNRPPGNMADVLRDMGIALPVDKEPEPERDNDIDR